MRFLLFYGLRPWREAAAESFFIHQSVAVAFNLPVNGDKIAVPKSESRCLVYIAQHFCEERGIDTSGYSEIIHNSPSHCASIFMAETLSLNAIIVVPIHQHISQLLHYVTPETLLRKSTTSGTDLLSPDSYETIKASDTN